MTRWAVPLFLFVAVLAHATLAATEPLLKPKKYHGPIPQSSFTLRVGFMSGADNSQMIDALELKPPFESFSKDFTSALSIDANYAHKVHPQFAVRANISASFLTTTSTGLFVPEFTDLPDTLDAPLLNFTRDFDVDLFVLEASALYFFADAAIQEFQPYFGGGFSVGMPHAKFNETRIDDDTDEVFIVMDGNLTIELHDGHVELKKGEMYVVPKGVEHKPVAANECQIMLIEPAGIVNTGEAGGELTAPNDEWI